MPSVMLTTNGEDFRPALTSGNSSASSFTAKIPTQTNPVNDGVIQLGDKNGGDVQNGVVVVPYGTGTATNTFNLRMIGWRRVGRNLPETQLWIPVVLCEITCTLCTVQGVGSTIIPSTMLFVDTLAIVTGNAGASIDSVSPTGNVIAHFTAAAKGFAKLEFEFKNTNSTDANCLVALL